MGERLNAWLMGEAAKGLDAIRFDFDSPIPVWLGWTLVLLGGGLVGAYCWRRLSRMPPRPRGTTAALRGLAIALAVFMLLDPCLVGSRVKPGEHYVALLFDDSRSMKIVGDDGLSREERVRKAYEAARPSFEEKLRRKFRLASYRFGSGAERIRDLVDLRTNESETAIAGSIQEALGDLEGLTVSAVVVFSDGIEQPGATAEKLDEVVRTGVPVFTVGTESEEAWRDLAIGDLSVTRTHFDKSPVAVTAPLKASGLAGSEAIVEVLEGTSVVQARTVALGAESEEQEVRLEFVPSRKGWIEYEARVRLAQTGPWDSATAVSNISVPGKDRVIQNNSRRFTIDNREKEYRILYFSGRPNWENKFFRRAVEHDPELKLSSLIRISKADRKFVFRGKKSNMTNPLFEGFEASEDQPRYDESVFLRIGMKEGELSKGYPILPEELFPYHLVVWGDIEYGFFSQPQLELTRDFVRKRGGTLLVLGGGHGFTEGGYAGTMVESMLPMVLRPGDPATRKSGPDLSQAFKAAPTLDGLLSGAWALDPNPDENRRQWEQMPDLRGLNTFALTRPGATVLSRADEGSGEASSPPLFSSQRFGEGKTAVLATGGTWPWRMELEADDARHERLIRQMVRSLISGVQEPIMVRSRQDSYSDQKPVPLEILIRDASFDEREALRVSASVRAPSGEESPLAVDESIHEAGIYKTQFTPGQAGMHILNVSAMDAEGRNIGSHEEAFFVEADQREFMKAQFNGERLREIASKTGGGYFGLNQLSELASRIPWAQRDAPDEMRFHLWHLPPFLIALLAMLSAEWLLRRRRGYA